MVTDLLIPFAYSLDTTASIARAYANDPAAALFALFESGCDRLPLPGCGHTLERWRALAAVAEADLSLAKLFESHTDALAIHAELGVALPHHREIWAVWAAESGHDRLRFERESGEVIRITGRKF